MRRRLVILALTLGCWSGFLPLALNRLTVLWFE